MTTDARPAGAEWLEANPPPAWRPGDPVPPPPPPPAPPLVRVAPPPDDAPAPPAREPERRPSAADGRSGESMSRFLDRLVRGGGNPPPERETEPADAGAGDAPDAPDGDDASSATAQTSPAPDADGTPQSPQTPAPQLSAQARRAIGQLKSLSEDDLAALAQTDGPIKRLLDGELDRRLMAQQRAAADRGQLTRQQQRALLAAQEQAVRQTDTPEAHREAARMRDQLDAMQAQDDFLTGMVKAYDRVSLDPLLLALPEADRKAILEAMPPSMDGRKYATEQAVARIKANEARRLLRSPAFRKQVLASMRGEPATPDDEDDEPELGAERRSSGARPAAGKSSMDAFIRRGFGQRVG